MVNVALCSLMVFIYILHVGLIAIGLQVNKTIYNVLACLTLKFYCVITVGLLFKVTTELI